MTVSPSQLSLFESVRATLGDRFTPFLIGGATFATVERALAQVLERSERALALVGFPEGIADPTAELDYLASAASSAQIFVLGGGELVGIPVPAHVQVFPTSSASKLHRERFWLILTDSFAALIVGSQQSAPHLEGAPPLVSFWSNDAEAISVALEVALQAIEQTLPQRAETVRAAMASFSPPPSYSDGFSDLTNALVQSLENAARDCDRQQEQNDSLAQTSMNNQELVRSLEAKDEFIKSIAQKLCTPLTNIKTAIQLLRSPNIKESQKVKYWDVLNSECDHQISLIDSLSELLELEEPERETLLAHHLSLFDLIPGTVSTFQAIAQEQGIMLAYTVPADLSPVDFPEADLKLVLVKLIENALQVTPAGGQVWVTASAQGPKFVQMEVRDTGLGIPSEDVPKIFDRFYRVPRAKLETPGVGLGLTVVQKLLLRSGGAISVQSKLGQGSTFTVMLPQRA
ncbi:MAG: HAMP domain-containing sensor histidine kinase [Cyanobacteria bacterium P01_F01_bin.33]